jgi:fucose 4-O-acetylase-like acetyltransferase
MTRDKSPDAIKGLCIILMVFGHTTYVGSLINLLSTINNFIYTFHMPLFLIVSGYFFNSNSDLKNRAIKVILRIGVPYVIFISLYLVGLILIQKIGVPTSNSPPKNITDFIYSVLLHPMGAYWFLHSLIIIQLTLLFSRYLANHFSSENNYLGITLLISACLLMAISWLHIISFRTVAYFIFGMLIKNIYGKSFSFPFSLALILTICFFVFDKIGGGDIYNIFSSSEVIWCLLLTALFWSFFNIKEGILTSNMAWIGRNTLIILVLHSLFIVAMKPLNSAFLAIDNTGVIQAVTVTLVTLLLSLLSAKISDAIKISIFIFGVEKIYSKKNQGTQNTAGMNTLQRQLKN